jgi:hypothetical protein
VRHVQGHKRILLHKEHGDTLAIDLDNGVEDRFDQYRREAHARLIQEQDLGFAHQRPAHGQHLLLAA